MHSNYVPAQQQKHLQFLDFNKAGDLIMGCSSLNTRYMTGSLWYYKAGTSAGAVTNPEACLTGVDTEAGVMDGMFVRDDQAWVNILLNAPRGMGCINRILGKNESNKVLGGPKKVIKNFLF